MNSAMRPTNADASRQSSVAKTHQTNGVPAFVESDSDSGTKKGTHLIQVRATNSNGQILKGERIVRVE